MNDVNLSDIHRLKGILRTHGLHEETCAGRCMVDDGQSWRRFPDCDCFLSEDPFDMEKDPPLRIEGFQNSAEQSRRHRYSDGRVRDWTKKRDGEWAEIVAED